MGVIYKGMHLLFVLAVAGYLLLALFLLCRALAHIASHRRRVEGPAPADRLDRGADVVQGAVVRLTLGGDARVGERVARG